VDVGADIVVGCLGICSSAVEVGPGAVPQPVTMIAINVVARDNRMGVFTSNLPMACSRFIEWVDKEAAPNHTSLDLYTYYVVEEFKSLQRKKLP